MILVGVDAGGTKTNALAVDEQGNVIGYGVGGQASYHRIGLDAAVSVIGDVCSQALQGQRADLIAYCLVDCDTDYDHGRLAGEIGKLALSERFDCRNDAFAALRAGSTRPYGVAVVCGTGFNACAIAPDGRQAKLHSLGPLTGDWGGGYSLGEAMFGAVYRADEGRGAPTMLTRMLLNALDLETLDAVTRLVTDNAINDAQIGALAPLVFEAAAQGDAVARSIIQRQADEICVAVMALLRRLDMTQLDVDVVLAGGVIQDPNPLLIASVSQQLLVENPNFNVRRLDVPPVIGATLLAFDLMGMLIPDTAKNAWAERAYAV